MELSEALKANASVLPERFVPMTFVLQYYFKCLLYVGLYIVYSVHFLCIRFFLKIFVITLLSQITECVFIF